LGHIYVKYLEPINLEKFVANKAKGKLCPHNFEATALKLTTHLMEQQQIETPVTLNSLISSWLLQETNPSLQMSDLLKRSEMVYNYMREKPWLKTHMTVRPMKNLVEKHITGLGFKMTMVTKNDCKILLDPKEDDLRVRLILAHYSMNLMPAFLIEGCLSIFLKNEVLTKDYYDGKPVLMGPLYEIIKLYANLFKNEHFTPFKVDKQ